jgi:cyclohexanone monooxygenase
MRDRKIVEIEASEKAEQDWLDECQTIASGTLHYRAPESSYICVTPSGKRVFMVYIGGFERYRKACDNSAVNNYAGFKLTPERSVTAVA